VDSRDAGALPEPGAVLWGGALPPHTLENIDTTEIRVLLARCRTESRMSVSLV